MNLETIILSKLTQEQKTKVFDFLTHKGMLNNEITWTQGEEHHIPESVGGWGPRRGIAGSGKIGEG